jgi:hypothetical protein
MKTPPSATVYWLDACARGEDIADSEIDEKCVLLPRRSKGYLARQNPTVTIVAQTIDERAPGVWSYADTITIPTGWITKITIERRRPPKPKEETKA